MDNHQIVWKNQKALRTGYTTGSCAAAAAQAAAKMLLSGEKVEQTVLDTPAGIRLYLEIEEIEMGEDFVRCAVRKDSGDDPDVTNGSFVYAAVAKRPVTEQEDEWTKRVETKKGISWIHLTGGKGVGTVTKKGLKQNIGDPAINEVPRRMILYGVAKEAVYYGCSDSLHVEISIPAGIELAHRTFNPRLGIEGGISVLGTSGIVEPMSEKALTDTIYVEMKMLKENGAEYCYVVPGNYGSDFLEQKLGYDVNQAVKCSNYIGETIDDAVRLGMKGILLVGHVGKLIKIAAGVMNTHSRQADARMEVLAAHSAMAGLSAENVKKLMKCITTTEALDFLFENHILNETMKTIMDQIEFHLKHRALGNLEIEAIVFSNERGILGMTKNAMALNRKIKETDYE